MDNPVTVEISVKSLSMALAISRKERNHHGKLDSSRLDDIERELLDEGYEKVLVDHVISRLSNLCGVSRIRKGW